MITVSFFLGCRECHCSDNIEHLYMLMDGNYEKYQKKTEFEVMTQIEQWREEENKKCDFCGSSNVEIFDVKINSTPLYNYEYLINRCKLNNEYLIIINIDKDGSQISLKKGGFTKLPNSFIEIALNKLFDLIESRPKKDFVSHDYATFFICITGKIIEDSLKIERYSNSGVTKDEIIKLIEKHLYYPNIGDDPIFS